MTIHKLYCNRCKTRVGPFVKVAKSNRPSKTIQYYSCNPCNTARFKAYYSKNKKKVRSIIYKSIKKHKDKQNARVQLNYHVRAGNIKKPTSCPLCDDTNKRIEAHHTDYSKPLDVMWMCSSCHGSFDRKMRLNS